MGAHGEGRERGCSGEESGWKFMGRGRRREVPGERTEEGGSGEGSSGVHIEGSTEHGLEPLHLSPSL